MLSRHVTYAASLLAFFSLLFVTSALGKPSFTEKPITEVGWSVELASFQYDSSSNTTTLQYGVTTSSWEKNLSHWVLMFNYDEFELVSINPSSPVALGLDPTTGGYGVKWDGGQQAGTYLVYTIVLRGNVEIGDIHYAVKGGTYYAVGDTQGPVGQIAQPIKLYSISGLVYVDAYANWTYDVNEPLLSNVTVVLRDESNNVIASVPTSANGQYRFENLPIGSYWVTIEYVTSMSDFNELLASYFIAATPTVRSISILSSDVNDVNFFFALNSSKIMSELSDDTSTMASQGVGKTIGFWKHQMSVAISGKGRAQIDALTLKMYLGKVELLFADIPFQFSDSGAYSEALLVLSNTSSAASDLLKKQLLALELNDVMGIGLLGGYETLQDVLINWSEFLAANSGYFTRDQLLAAKDICDSINNLNH